MRTGDGGLLQEVERGVVEELNGVRLGTGSLDVLGVESGVAWRHCSVGSYFVGVYKSEHERFIAGCSDSKLDLKRVIAFPTIGSCLYWNKVTQMIHSG